MALHEIQTEGEQEYTREVVFSSVEIDHMVTSLGKNITRDYQGESLTLLFVLDAATIFGADLVRTIDSKEVQLRYRTIDATSYDTSHQAGEVVIQDHYSQGWMIGQNILIVDTMVNTGGTMRAVDKYTRRWSRVN